jgi:tetratricopeptide (TPR) repeat protein
VFVASGLLAATAWVAWHRSIPSHAATELDAIIEIPKVELTGVDPAIRRAIEAAQVGVAQSPRSPDAWGQLGKVLLAHEFHFPANACLTQAERLDPAQPRWPFLRGVAMASADPPDPSGAIDAFRRAVELGGDSPDALRLRLAEALLAQDRLEEAEQQFGRVLELNPANGRAHLGLARLAIRRGQAEKSQSHLEHALADPHRRKAARLLWIEVQQRLGKEPSPDESREVARLPDDVSWPDPYMQEVSRVRTGMKANLRRAENMLNQNHLVEAIALLQKVVKEYPDSYYSWLILGRALTRQKNLKAAEQALNTAFKLAPESPETQFYLGVVLHYQGNYRKAETLFRGAAEAKPNFANAHYNLGHCLVQKGDRPGAIEAFRVALRCQPDFADAHTSLSLQLVEIGRYKEALAHAQLALQYNAADPFAKKLVQRFWSQVPISIGP